jgi:hypothetical protein
VKVEGKELLFGGGLLFLLAIGLVRVMGPERPRMRPISIEALDVPPEVVGTGDTLTREAHWQPPDDIYLIGWLPRVGAPGAEPELLLRVGDLRIFETHWPVPMGVFFPEGSGYLVRKGQTLTVRYSLHNTGPAADSRGARVLLYFVPVAGN